MLDFRNGDYIRNTWTTSTSDNVRGRRSELVFANDVWSYQPLTNLNNRMYARLDPEELVPATDAWNCEVLEESFADSVRDSSRTGWTIVYDPNRGICEFGEEVTSPPDDTPKLDLEKLNELL